MSDMAIRRILLVDDTEANRYALGRHLRRAGYAVAEAETGKAALEEVKKHPDLIILDVKLPDISGYEISRRVRKDPETSLIPILQISATFTMTGDRVKGLDAGADGYLTGPVQPEELLANVRMLLRLKQAQDDLAQARDQLKLQNEALEQRVRERTAKLQETIIDLETFSYSITHDMRAPLRAMQGFSKILIESHGPKLEPEAVDFLQRISNSANRLDMLIRDVLSYSNIIRAELKLVPVDADKLLRDILREYPGFQPPQAEIKVRERLPVVLANEAFLTQCFSNLLSNAVKFVAPGTRPRVEVSAEKKDGVARLNFKDNGIGIPPQHQRHLFTLFHRAQSKYPGTGIGLAVVSKAVERMGGKAGVESDAGKGSTFWVELQLSEAAVD